MHLPRILLAAGSSGSGKTLLTCGLLQALILRKKKVASFKCGPDYIDPMFHSRVIGTKARNLDPFFTKKEITRYLLAKNAADCEIAVIEGVMGYYDGVAGITTRASTYELADQTDTPVLLIVNSRGMSTSLAAYIRGFLSFRENSHIQGVIFNQMSPSLYLRMKAYIEHELKIPVYGYVPLVRDCVIESRHLGLVLPDEIPALQKKLDKLATVLEETLDIDGILSLADQAPKLCVSEEIDPAFSFHTELPVRIGLASDEAFCFIYEDNLQLLRQMGATLVPFSPIHDRELPPKLDGLLLYGGYPELYAKELEENRNLREAIKKEIRNGLPVLAECGGFLYLHEELKDLQGVSRQMAGVIPGRAYKTEKLSRFGYLTLTPNQNEAERGGQPSPSAESLERALLTDGDLWTQPVPAHEFHYYESDSCGTAFHASKPQSGRAWDCIHLKDNLFAGFPHLYYYGNPGIPAAFLKTCVHYHRQHM